jgi:hypothetical protein
LITAGPCAGQEALTMRALPLFALAGYLLGTFPASAQITQFPYEAVVQADDVFVRSGPGQERYYPTGKLKQGDRVTVVRHDPGGWYVIVPPPGSFSWIDAGLVRKTGPNQGTVEVPQPTGGPEARAIVRIGSQFGDDCSIYSRELATGDVVEILGEKQLRLERGPALMYQIKPPAQEFRWVKGDYIVPVSAQLKQERDRDPFATPSTAKPAPENDPFGAPGTTIVRERELQRGTPTGAAATATDARLQELDHRYASMMAQDPSQWRLDELEREYQTLDTGSDAALQRIVEQRLAAIRTRRQALADYLEFLRLTSETTQRDAQLLSMQTGRPVPVFTSNPLVQLGPPQSSPESASVPPTSGAQLGPTIEALPEEPLPQAVDQVAPRLDGAGIIQRSSNPLGFVQYVLTAPNGGVLATLEPGQGINLEPYVGRPMGVIGQRTHDPRTRVDRIEVRRLTPVQLIP